MKRYIISFNIDTSHFRTIKNGGSHKKYGLSDILVEISTYFWTKNLKDRLYKEGLKKRECKLCGQGEMWKNKKMSLILEHINGNNSDNRIDNLRIICPNCNDTLDTFSGRNIKNKKNKLLVVDKKIKNGLSDKQIENKIKSRKVTRPEYDLLIEDIKKMGYVATGKNMVLVITQ